MGGEGLSEAVKTDSAVADVTKSGLYSGGLDALGPMSEIFVTHIFRALQVQR